MCILGFGRQQALSELSDGYTPHSAPLCPCLEEMVLMTFAGVGGDYSKQNKEDNSTPLVCCQHSYFLRHSARA